MCRARIKMRRPWPGAEPLWEGFDCEGHLIASFLDPRDAYNTARRHVTVHRALNGEGPHPDTMAGGGHV